MKRIHLLSSTLVLLGASALGVGCQDSFKDCENTRTCPRPGDGDGDTSTGGGDGDGDTGGGVGDGDTGGTGGVVGTGGGDGDGDGDGDSTGGMGGDPNNACLLCEEGEYCTSELECVECFNDDHCDDAAPVCDPSTFTCVSCVDDADCEDPALPMCDAFECVSGCEAPADCERFEDTPVCDSEGSGECVGCLNANDCGGDVCDPDANTCTNLEAGVLGACDECQYDAQCAPGRVCVETSYSNPTPGLVGNFCLWRMDATGVGAPGGACGLNSQPYAQDATVTSVNGSEPVVVCQLRTTTCLGLKDHAVDVPECQVAGGDDAACGAEGFNDGRCRGTGSTLCTYPCGGVDDRDCPGGFACLDVAGDRYCGI